MAGSVKEMYTIAGALDCLHALEELCGIHFDDAANDPRSAMPFTGGAMQGMQRLELFLHGSQTAGTGAHNRPGPCQACSERSSIALETADDRQKKPTAGSF